MARVPIYTNSFAASAVSLTGFGIAALGITVTVKAVISGGAPASVLVPGIVCIVIGLAMGMWAPQISENKQFRDWKKKIETTGLVDQIKADAHIAIMVYNTNPCQKSLDYISLLNPKAGAYIAAHRQAKKD